MKEIIDISYTELAFSFLLMAIPLFLLHFFKIKLGQAIVIAVIRMLVQLSLVAFYLEIIFDLNNLYLNLLWVFIMIIVGVTTTIKRVALNWKLFALPLSIAATTSIIIVDTFFLGLIIKLDYIV